MVTIVVGIITLAIRQSACPVVSGVPPGGAVPPASDSKSKQQPGGGVDQGCPSINLLRRCLVSVTFSVPDR